MSNVNEIFAEIVQGLENNSEVNHCEYSEGWAPEDAISTYYDDDERVLQEQGDITEEERAKLVFMVHEWLEEHQGRAWHDSNNTATRRIAVAIKKALEAEGVEFWNQEPVETTDDGHRLWVPHPTEGVQGDAFGILIQDKDEGFRIEHLNADGEPIHGTRNTVDFDRLYRLDMDCSGLSDAVGAALSHRDDLEHALEEALDGGELAALSTTFKHVDGHGEARLVTVVTSCCDLCQDMLVRVEDGKERLQDAIEWWDEWGTRRHAVEVAAAEGELDGFEPTDQDDDFEVYVTAREQFLEQQDASPIQAA